MASDTITDTGGVKYRRQIVANIGMTPLSYWHFIDPVKRHRRHFNKRKTHCIATAEAMIVGDEFDFMWFMQKHPNFILVGRKSMSDMVFGKISMTQIENGSWDYSRDYVNYKFGNNTEWEVSKEPARMMRISKSEIRDWWWSPDEEYADADDILSYDNGNDNIRNMSRMMSKSAWRK